MNLYQSQRYGQDLTVVAEKFPQFQELNEKTVLITGAGGLICSAVVDLLMMNNRIRGCNTQIYAAGRSQERMFTRFSRWKDCPEFHFLPYDAREEISFRIPVDFIIHGASNAYPAAIQKHPVDTMLDNFTGTYQLLKYAGLMGSGRVLLISSSEVYGTGAWNAPMLESQYGYMDILNPRASYASSKRAAETLCASFLAEYNVESIIVRPGHIYGPTASRADNRVSSQFAYLASEGKNIVLKSDGSQIRSYCYMMDAATAILFVLLKGKTGEAYNISNPDSIISIRQLAELFAERGNVKLEFAVPSCIEKTAFNPMVNSSLNSEKLQGIGWKGLYSAERGIEHTLEILKEARL